MSADYNKLLLFQPSYMSNFSCIGPACEDNCCYGWKIQVDKNSYEKYISTNNDKFKELFRLYLVEDNNSYHITHKNGDCPFLNENQLCIIHKDLGEDFLCDTCTVYPRAFNILNDSVEVSASVSCPVIAKLALTQKQGLDFEYTDAFDRYKYLPKRINSITHIIDVNDDQYDDSYIKYLWNLRNFCIDILQNQNTSLDQRLVLLGLFLDKVDSAIKSEKIDSIPNIINLFSGYISNMNTPKLYKQDDFSYSIKFKILIEILSKKAYSANKSYTFHNYYKEFLQGLNYYKGKDIKDVLEAYNSSYNKYLKPFTDNHTHILENYLVNYIFRTLFPLDRNNEIFKPYVLLVVNYSLLKFYLSGIASFNKGIEEDMAIAVIQSYAKVINHNSSFVNEVYKMLKDCRMDNIKNLAVLLMD
ncbi:flagellin lysine-N-methylase [Wukongibacter baidiensis]|uniref:flagellin lysine-N-methylase n=1 Tax=Wukongibacter baidiensis TaxID=1723361 RepID=UPI003D7F3704